MPPPAAPSQWARGGGFASALSRQPNDAMFAQYATEWHLLRIAAPAAWEVATGSPQVGGRATRKLLVTRRRVLPKHRRQAALVPAGGRNDAPMLPWPPYLLGERRRCRPLPTCLDVPCCLLCRWASATLTLGCSPLTKTWHPTLPAAGAREEGWGMPQWRPAGTACCSVWCAQARQQGTPCALQAVPLCRIVSTLKSRQHFGNCHEGST